VTHWTIGKKLLTGIGALLILVAVTGWLGLRNAAELNGRLEIFASSFAQQIEHSDNTEVQAGMLYENAAEILVAAYEKDAAKLQRVKAETAAELTSLEDEVQTLAKIVDSEQDRTDVAHISAAVGKWKSAFARLQASVDAGNLPEAGALLDGDVKLTSSEVVKAAKIIADAQFVEMRESKKAAEESYATARALSIGAAMLSMLTGFALAWLMRGVNRTLRQTARELLEGALQTASAASQVSTSSQSLAQGCSEQAASLQETSSSAEEINSMASKNTENSRSAAELVNRSQQGFMEANKALEQMVVSMAEIAGSSDKISKIIKMIDEIAFQTNILAFYAAVVAARAGEAGLGLAVVADEVRYLAQRCAQAARDTAILIEESVTKSSDGKGKVDHMAVTLRAITEELARIRILVDEVDCGSQEQARGIEQISKAIVQMERVTQATTASAEESASASEELTAQSRSVNEIVERLTAMVGSEDGSGASSRR
jgi:methyl-accepting chemotaxis protein